MARFHYEAQDSDGRAIDGSVTARNRGHAMVLLREHDLRVRVLLEEGEYQQRRSRQAVASWGQGPLYPLWPVSPSSVGLFFDQLGRLLGAGVTPHEAFTSLEQRVGGRLRRVAREGIPALAAGEAISAHLARYPRFFPPYVVAIFHAGELSGALKEACDEIVHQCDVDRRVRVRWLITKLYFGVLLLGAVLIAPFPRMIIRYSAKELPPGATPAPGGVPGIGNILGADAARILRPGLEAYAGHVLHHILPWLLGLWLLSKGIVVVLSLPSMVSVRDWLALHIPVVSSMARRAAVARFARTFELMQRAAVPLGAALREAASATGNILVARRVAQPAANLERGGSLTNALDAAGIFAPADVSRMATAEQTGTLDDALARLSPETRQSRDDFLKIVGYGSWVGALVVTAGCVLVALVVGYTGYFNEIMAVFETDAWQP